MKQVAIIGLGISGAAVLRAYALQAQVNVQIHVFDDANKMGKGIPFAEPFAEALINSPKDDISFDYQKMHDFEEWLVANQIETELYTSRFLYGQYSADKTNALLKQLQANVHHTKIISMTKQNQQWLLTDHNQQTYLVDHVHLCCGELPIQDYYQLKGSKHYIHNPFPLSQIPTTYEKTASVTLIGMGLTTFDVLKYLLSQSNIQKIYLFSRSGYLPTMRGEAVKLSFKYLTETAIHQLININHGILDYQQFEQLFYDELKYQQIDLEEAKLKLIATGRRGVELSLQYPKEIGKLQAIAMQLSTILSTTLSTMTITDRQKYMEKYHKLLLILRNPAPPVTGKILLDAIDNGIVEIIQDVSEIVEADNDSFTIALENPTHLRTDWLINTTGMQLNQAVSLSEQTLLFDLVNKHYVQIDSTGGLAINVENGCVISAKYGVLSNLQAHGMLIEGVIYQNNSTIKIQKLAEKYVTQLM